MIKENMSPLWQWPEVNSFAAIGPHPYGGGRFYGLTNQTATLLLPPMLVAGALAGIPGLAGLALTALSMAWIAAGVAAESYALMLPALLLVGVSIQVLFAAPMTAITLTTPASAQGETSGIISTSQMVGGTFGIAIFSALISAGLSYARRRFIFGG